MWKPVAFGLALVLMGHCHAAEIAGYVLAIGGNWSVQGSGQALSVGAPVSPGARLVPRSAKPTDHITVVAARSGLLLVTRRCGATPACGGPIELPRAASQPPGGALVAQLLDRVMSRIVGEPDRYATNLSRGLVALHDAVLVWDDGRVELAPLLSPLLAEPPDTVYELQFVRVCPAGGTCTGAAAVPRSNWSPSGSTLLRPEGLVPGLYRLTLRSSDNVPGQAPQRCWVLLVPSAERDEFETRYQAGLDLVRAWGDQVPEATRQLFRRALLEALAEP